MLFKLKHAAAAAVTPALLSPQPPHVAVLVGEEAVGVITAVLDIVKSAAVDRKRSIPRFGAGEALHKPAVRVVVTAAISAHVAAETRERGERSAPVQRSKVRSGGPLAARIRGARALLQPSSAE